MTARAVWSWALYDFANTIFYGVVVTFYLPLHVKEMCGGKTAPFALAFFPAMIVSALVSPSLGELADRTGRAKRFTMIATVLCCACSAALALASTPAVLLALFAVSLLAYQSAIGFYNALLPSVADDAVMARVSGLGVGLGYLGNVFALWAARGVVNAAGGDVRPAFVLAGALMAVFSLPLAFFCRDRVPAPTGAAARVSLPALVRSNLGASARLVRRAATDRGLLLFFLGNFLCADVLNTVYSFLRLWIESPSGLGLPPFPVMIALNIACLPAALLLGALADRSGEKRVTLIGVVGLLAAVVVPQALTTFVASSGEGSRVRFVAGAVVVVAGAIGVGGLLGASRKWLVRLVPASEVGGWFGVYGLTSKLSLLSIGPFALLVDASGSYGGSVMLLAFLLCIGLVLLARAPARGAA